jgi:hypothetical protein
VVVVVGPSMKMVNVQTKIATNMAQKQGKNENTLFIHMFDGDYLLR